MVPSADAEERRWGISATDVLYDGHRDCHCVAIAVTDRGVTLRCRDTEQYVPHAILAEWHDSGRITRNEAVGDGIDVMHATDAGVF